MEHVNLTRAELHALAWSEPLSALAKRYRLSEYSLRKICIDLAIPLPRAGHWKKAHSGEQVSIPPLPPGQPNTTVKLPAPFVEQKAVSVQKSALDPLLVIVNATLTAKDAHLYDGLRRNKSGQLEIRAAPHNVDRAIEFMHNFLQALRGRGHSIEINSEGSYAVVQGQKINIRCREKCKRVTRDPKSSYLSSELQPTGILGFQMTIGFSWSTREWKEGNQSLDEQIPAILDKLENESRRLVEEKREREKYWAEQAEKDRITKELEQRKQAELAGLQSLFTQANRWHQTVDLRGYLAAFEEHATAAGTLTEEQREWLTWSRAKVDWYDPFLETPDKWLADIDRDTLQKKKTHGTF